MKAKKKAKSLVRKKISPKGLVARRKKLKLSQIAVAKGAKLSRFRISTFECGYENLSPTDMMKVASFIIKKEQAHV